MLTYSNDSKHWKLDDNRHHRSQEKDTLRSLLSCIFCINLDFDVYRFPYFSKNKYIKIT